MKNLAFRLALAGLMLVVITSGTAFAETIRYTSGVSGSYFNGPSDCNQISYSSGNLDVNTGDTLIWQFNMSNRLGRQIGYQIGAFGLNLNTYYYGGFSSTTSGIYPLSAFDNTGPTDWAGIVIASSDNHAIMEGHTYWDGGYSYTLTFGIGGGAGTEKRFHF